MDNSKSVEKKFNINANKFYYTSTRAATRKKVKKARHSSVRQIVRNAVNYPPPIEVGACRKTSSVD